MLLASRASKIPPPRGKSLKTNMTTQKSSSHPQSKASPARRVALEVGRRCRQKDAYVSETLQSVLDETQISPVEQAFATKLALGVASTWGTLDEVIDRYVKAPKDLSNSLRDVLRVGTYEILFLDKSAHAAVDQGVELAKGIAPRAAGLVNAVLRKVAGAKTQFPFGDPRTDLAALARLYAFPSWLAELLMADLGVDAAIRFMQASNEDAPLFVAVNAVKAEDAWVQKKFTELGFTLSPVRIGEFDLPGCFRLAESKAIAHPQIRNLFAQGKILVSDVASQVVAHLAVPDKQPRTFLEIGAGRGTKTILLQSDACRRFGTQMNLIAIDSYQFKADIIIKRAATYGIEVADAVMQDATDLQGVFEEASLDAIFIDAPCSGLGTLRRHPEIRWRLKPEEITALARVDHALLDEAAKYVAVGGMITYSTCTVTKEENEKVVKRFLESDRGKEFSLLPFAGKNSFSTQLASGSSDAHFAVRLVRDKTVV